MERRLAAILAADVVGYSRLMEADEVSTLSALRQRRRDILDPLLAKHHGRIVKVMGDGVLVEFASALNAVECAVELQGGMAAANAQVPDDRRMVLRVGINLGDVIAEGGDIYGDGVNIAARLEALAEPGGVLVSGKIHHEVASKLKLSFEDLGERSLKNLQQPVRVYRLSGTNPGDSVAPFYSVGGASRSSIAVLPFNNMSGDSSQEYFSDGITEDIITELTRFRQLFVIARNSSFTFRGRSVDITEVGRKLGVQYVVEGSVRRIGSRVRITAQLIEAATGNHIWAERYDRDAEDIFEVQDEVVQNIVSALFGQVEDAGAKQAKRKHPESLAAYDHLLQGIQHHQRGAAGDLTAARKLIEKAIDIDPDFAIAYAWLALIDQNTWDSQGSPELIQSALRHARRAVELDEDDARCHVILGYIYLCMRQLEPAEFHHRRALSLNPNDAHITTHMGLLSAYLGDSASAIQWIKKALRLNPYAPEWYRSWLGMAYYVGRHYEQAVANLDPRMARYAWNSMYSAASFAQVNRMDEAHAQLAELRALRPSGSLIEYASAEPFKNAADRDHLIQGLRKAGLLK
jgi:TolB-like protein/class 3 adenylate cyclase/Flp pilus assembly protein TadD